MKTVLLIEDNQEIRENMGEILDLAGYRTLMAANGKLGASVAIAERPDIIVCDIMMPELDGYGVIHLLQKNEDTKNIPFIFITAKAERTEMRKGMELGADDYITKPFSGTELLNAIEGRLKKSEALRSSQPGHSDTPGNDMTGPPHRKSLENAFREEQDSQTVQKKQKIYTEGQKAFRLYQIASGKVKTYKTNDDGKDLIINICKEGDYFGYTALLEGTLHRETAEALEESEVSSITKEAFEELINNNPEMMGQFMKLLAGNVHTKEEQLLGIAYNSLRKKVAEALIMLQRKFQDENTDAHTPIQISRDNLAAIAGTAKESLIRTLGDFRDEGLIEISASGIVLLDGKKILKMLN